MNRLVLPPGLPRRGLLPLWLACVVTLAPACDADREQRSPAARAAVEIGDAEGAVCGMTVREQSAPRVQVVHRDGERLFLCSIGDFLIHDSGHSPHGAIEAIFVEVLEPGEDPMQSHPGPHDWVPAEEAVYVVGVPRRGIMGPPVLVYRDASAAASVVAAHAGARVLDLAGVREWWRARQ